MNVTTLRLPATHTPAAALFQVLAGGALIGFAPVMARFSEVGPLATAGWRMLAAVLVLAPVVVVSRGRPAGGRHSWIWISLSGLAFALDLGFFHMALQHTSVAHATLLVNLAPVVALGAGVVLFGEVITRWKIVGLIAALAGAALMTQMRADVSGTLTGNAMALVGMLGYSAYLIAVKQARASLSALDVMFGSSVVCAVALFAGAFMTGEVVLPVTMQGIAILAALGVIAHAMGQGLVALGMGQTPVGLASILLLVQPLVAAITAWFVFREGMGAVEMLGALLVLAGIAAASRSRT